MGNYTSKSKAKSVNSVVQKLKNPHILLPANIYNFFRGPGDEETSVPIAVKTRDFIDMMLAYAQGKPVEIAAAGQIFTNIPHIFREKFKINIQDFVPYYLDGSEIKLDTIFFVVPNSFVENQITDPAAEPTSDADAQEKAELMVNREIPQDFTLANDGDDLSEVGSIGAYSDFAPSITSNASSRFSASSKKPKVFKMPSAPKPTKTAQDKINDALALTVSPCRLSALDSLKKLLSDENSFEQLRTSMGAAGSIDKVIFARCIRAIIRALLKDVVDNKSNTLAIIGEISGSQLAGHERILLDHVSATLSGRHDQRPVSTTPDLLKFLTRFSIVLKSKPKHFFDDFFDTNMSCGSEERELGSQFEKKSVQIIKSLFETCLTPSCNAAIFILRNIIQDSNSEVANETDRFHLIALLIYRTTIAAQSTSHVLNNHSAQPLAQYVLAQLATVNYSTLTDVLDVQPSMEEKKNFYYCMAYTLNELPRQILKSTSAENLGRISQMPQNTRICKDLQKEAKAIEAKIKAESLTAIEEGSESQDNTPVKAQQKGGASPLAASITDALGNMNIKLSFVDNDSSPPTMTS